MSSELVDDESKELKKDDETKIKKDNEVVEKENPDEEEEEILEVGPNHANKTLNLFFQVDQDIEMLDLTRRRMKKIEGMEFMRNLKSLCMRWNLLKKVENLQALTTLVELDLYDNQVCCSVNIF